ncbi:uncharacterized protein METZ01_LOCUS278007, partial [marine metagenome]
MAQDKRKIQQVIKKVEEASKLLRSDSDKLKDAIIDESRFKFIFPLLVLKRISELTFSTHRRKRGCKTLPGYLLDLIVSNRALSLHEIEHQMGPSVCKNIQNAIEDFEVRTNRYPTDKEMRTIHGEVLTDAEWNSLYDFE